jgi:hypothetical protein
MDQIDTGRITTLYEPDFKQRLLDNLGDNPTKEASLALVTEFKQKNWITVDLRSELEAWFPTDCDVSGPPS